MKTEKVNWSQYKNHASAKKALIKLLQNAHAGEKAAANAYWGHAHSLFVTEVEQNEILKIYSEELEHREKLHAMLLKLKAHPRLLREALMYTVGFFIGVFSFFGTWLIPMYGAGRLESSNIGEYEVAARLSYLANCEEFIDELLDFAEVEHDHEVYFRKKIQSRYGEKRHLPLWEKPLEKSYIRSSMAEFIRLFKN